MMTGIYTDGILYLHTILNRSPEDLINKVYKVLKADPSPGDFCQLLADN